MVTCAPDRCAMMAEVRPIAPQPITATCAGLVTRAFCIAMVAEPQEQRPTTAAMAVIVHHQRVADPFGFDARALGAERAQADRDIEQPVGMGAHRARGGGIS